MFIIKYIYRSNVNLQHILHMHVTAFYNFHKCKSIIFISLVTLARPSLVVFAKMAPIPEKMFNLKCKMEILKIQVLYKLVPVGITEVNWESTQYKFHTSWNPGLCSTVFWCQYTALKKETDVLALSYCLYHFKRQLWYHYHPINLKVILKENYIQQ